MRLGFCPSVVKEQAECDNSSAMTSKRSIFSFAVFVLAILGAGYCADDAPSKMTHLVAQMSGDGIAPDSFAAKPKLMWRASNRYCRMDEEPDPEHGIHGRLVVNEPDAWLVNLQDNTAQHMVDTGPTFNCKMPMFAFDKDALKTKVGELEFGRELDFFRSHGAKLVEGPKLSFDANYYALPIEGARLMLVERMDIHAPIRVILIRGDKQNTVKYLLWDDQVPFKGDLFAKPSGVTIKEIQ